MPSSDGIGMRCLDGAVQFVVMGSADDAVRAAACLALGGIGILVSVHGSPYGWDLQDGIRSVR